jgi:hypothetical protein
VSRRRNYQNAPGRQCKFSHPLDAAQRRTWLM